MASMEFFSRSDASVYSDYSAKFVRIGDNPPNPML